MRAANSLIKIKMLFYDKSFLLVISMANALYLLLLDGKRVSVSGDDDMVGFAYYLPSSSIIYYYYFFTIIRHHFFLFLLYYLLFTNNQ